MTPEREELERQLKTFEDAKRAAKGNDDKAFLQNARGIVATIKSIAKLSDDNQITDRQVSSYCWALYAVWSKSADALERRQMAVRLVCAYRRKIDSSRFWGDEKASEFGKTLFYAIILRLYKLVKDANEGAETTLLKAIAKPYLEMLSLRAEPYLDEAAFRKDPVTEVQRKAMEAHAGKKIKMKEWPSLAEKAFGLMKRCLKADETAMPSGELVSFLGKNVGRGDWLGFYCAFAHLRRKEFAKARKLLVEVVRRKQSEAWAWECLAQAFRDQPAKMAGCLCKVLLCPSHDRQIKEAMSVKARHQLAKCLTLLGRADEARRESELAVRKDISDANDEFYRRESAEVVKEVLGGDGPNQASAKAFSGRLIKHGDNAFGFVKDKALGSVFIPPRFASKYNDGEIIKGKAALKEDKKKNKMSYCMMLAL